METATVVLAPATWLPEDDTMLKSAIEDGASLEALAKGAVPFSRAFTLQEVHDRWHDMLYNPVTSVQVSTHLFPDESDKPKEINASRRKRKVGTLRKRYHERVKRYRNEFFSSADLGFVNEPTLHDGPQVSNGVLGDCIENSFGLQVTNFDTDTAFPQDLANLAADYGGSTGGDVFHSEGLDPPARNHVNEAEKNNCLQRSTVADSPFPETGKSLLLGEELSNANVYSMGFSPPLPNMPLWKTMEDAVPGDKKQKDGSKSERVENFIHSASISDSGFGDLPEALFDFSNDDMLTDMDVINTTRVGEKDIVVANLDEISNSDTVLGEEKVVSQVKVDTSSSPLINKPLEKGVLYCALNTEDPEIPCNDDIFLLIHPDSSNPSIKASAGDINNTQLNFIKKRELAQSSKSSLIFGTYVLPQVGPVHTSRGTTFNAELIDSYEDSAPKHRAVADLTQSRPAKISLVSAAEGSSDKDVKKVASGATDIPAILRGLPMQNESGGVGTSLPEPEENQPKSDQEGSESENDDLHFSDIEAMILDMDLASYDDDLHFTRRVLKYQQENSKKEIIRMEQCARASLQRVMTSRGAIAVLYGRRSRHFIRKTEVILGRATEETAVDIDLGKEGLQNKISRRQAIVKMETDGSFTLKNLAKNPMFVNGVEVGSGELTILGTSCLIEIRGISFVFETNQKYVNSFRKNITKRGQMANFESIPKHEGA